TEFAEWLSNSPRSPLAATPEGDDVTAWFDVKLIVPRRHNDIDITRVPEVFRPRVGPFQLVDDENVYGVDAASDIFTERGVDRATGAVVVVRPDQYVAAVLPLAATDELGDFFAPLLASRVN